MMTFQMLSDRCLIRGNPISLNDSVSSKGAMRLKGLLIAAMCSVSIFMISTSSNAGDATGRSADTEMGQGKTYFQKGSFVQAALKWTEAARLYEQQGKIKEQTQALINLAQALQQEGQIKKAAVTLQVALKLAEQQGDRVRTAVILGRLGNAAFALGRGDEALGFFKKALTTAREEDKPKLTATLLNDMGNVLAAQTRTSEAMEAFTESYDLAQRTGLQTLAATTLINQSMTFIQDGRYAEAQRPLDMARAEVQMLEDSHDKVSTLLNIGLAYDDLHTGVTPPKMLVEEERGIMTPTRGVKVLPGQSPKPSVSEREFPKLPEKDANLALAPQQNDPASITPSSNLVSTLSDSNLLRQASEALNEAGKMASNLGDSRSESYAWGYLGHLAENARRYDDALAMTRKAVFAAQKTNAPESLYRWHWQTARVFKALRKDDEALSAYRRAVAILQPIRSEFSVGYQSRRHSFSESVRPLFTEVADVLLRRAALTEDPAQSQGYLVQVRDSTEAFRAAELQDYFRDDCVKTARANRTTQDAVSKTTAIVYPIILPDRLELLVSVQGVLKRYPVPVSEDVLTQKVRVFRQMLQDRSTGSYVSHAQTLYDWLLRPMEQDLNAKLIDTLVFVPDGPLRTIPMAALHDGTQHVINRYALAVTPGMDLTDIRPINRANINLLSMGLTESVQGFPALPNVKAELDTLNSLYGGKQLMNDQFVVPTMEREMKEQRFNMVHIASHGLVENDVNDSFLLAHDDKITMDRLSKLIGMFQYRKNPLELLTLSACETAVGDDRAALGLAGVAIKAGARSALATLWFIDDEATSALVAEFYRQLQDPTISKAVALQRAQVKILNEPGRDHPSFWAPFLLINNWL